MGLLWWLSLARKLLEGFAEPPLDCMEVQDVSKLLSFTEGPMALLAFSSSWLLFSIRDLFLLIHSHMFNPILVSASPRTNTNTSGTRSGLRNQVPRQGFGTVSPTAHWGKRMQSWLAGGMDRSWHRGGSTAEDLTSDDLGNAVAGDDAGIWKITEVWNVMGQCLQK